MLVEAIAEVFATQMRRQLVYASTILSAMAYGGISWHLSGGRETYPDWPELLTVLVAINVLSTLAVAWVSMPLSTRAFARYQVLTAVTVGGRSLGAIAIALVLLSGLAMLYQPVSQAAPLVLVDWERNGIPTIEITSAALKIEARNAEPSKVQQAQRWFAEGLYEKRRRNYAAAAKAFRLSGEILPTAAALVNEADALLLTLNTLQTERAQTIAAEAVRVAEKTGMPQIMGAAYFRLGEAYLEQDAYAAAEEAFSKAAQHFINAGDSVAAMASLNRRAAAQRFGGKIKEAVTTLTKALRLIRSGKDRSVESDLLGNLGALQTILGQYEDAERSINKALDIDREIRYEIGEAQDLVNLGILYRLKGQSTVTLERLEEAKEIFRRHGYVAAEFRLVNSLANIRLIDFRDAKGAREHLQEAAALLKTHNNLIEKRNLASYSANWSDLLLREGKTEQAITSAEEAVENARRHGAPIDVAGYLLDLANLYLDAEGQGNAAEALLDEARKIRMSVPDPSESWTSQDIDRLLSLVQTRLRARAR
jgi:tetratricopeptide (TPR) repeat protein